MSQKNTSCFPELLSKIINEFMNENKKEKEKKKLLLDSNKVRNYNFITSRWKMKVRTWCIAFISHRIQISDKME